MAGGSTGVPYLGSKISLTSNSQIRYEGILYTIDARESTVALAKVRSFGTEDRPTDRPVAPRDEVYEYIIFRGTDIKDIRVCGPPKPQPTLQGGLPNDPAILQHSAVDGVPGPVPPNSNQGQQQQQSYGPIGSSLGGGPSGFSASTENPVVTPKQPSLPASTGSAVMDLLREGRSGNSSPAEENATVEPPVNGWPKAAKEQSNWGGRREEGWHRGHSEGWQDHNRSRGAIDNRSGNQAPARFHRNRGRGGQGYGGHRNRGGRQAFPPGRPQFSKKDTLKFDADYDFEQANEQFQEVLQELQKCSTRDNDETEKAEPSSGQNGEVEEGEIKESGETEESEEKNDEPYYDKTKSFFDSISCEAIERSRGQAMRQTRKSESRLNRETFGVSGYHHHGDRRVNYNDQDSRNFRNYNKSGYRHYNGGYQNGYSYGGRGGGRENSYSNHRDSRFSRDNSGGGRSYNGNSGWRRNISGAVRGGHQSRARNPGWTGRARD